MTCACRQRHVSGAGITCGRRLTHVSDGPGGHTARPDTMTATVAPLWGSSEHSWPGRIGVVDDHVGELQRPQRSQIDPLSGDVAPAVPQLGCAPAAEDGPVTLDGPGERDLEVDGQEDSEVPTVRELGPHEEHPVEDEH